MPRIPFTDLASAPEFKSLPVEDQQKVSENYWNEVAAEQPDRAEFYGQMRDASKSLFDLKAKRDDAAPVQRRFLDAQVQDTAFMLSLGDEAAAGRLTPEGRDEAIKLRDTERAERQAQLDKTASLFKPEVQQKLAPDMDAMRELAAKGGVFGTARLDARVADILPGGQKDVVASSKAAYESLRNNLAADYDLAPEEVDDVIRHQLDLQPEPVSRDAFGTPYIKDEVIAAGPAAAEQAIKLSTLPWSLKQEMVKDLPAKINRFRSGVLERVRTETPDLAKQMGIDQPGDEDANFQTLVTNLNDTRTKQFAGGFEGAFAASMELLERGNVGTPQDRSGLFRDNGAFTEANYDERVAAVKADRTSVEMVNALSSQFNKSKTEIWGTDAAAFGSGAYSVTEAVGLSLMTSGLGTPVALSRIATMGKTGARLATFTNKAIAVAPVAGFAGAKTAASTYEQALEAGKTEDEAFDLAAKSGAIEAGVTMLFSGLGAGGVEDVGQQLAGGALRQSARESAKSAYRMFGEKLALGIAGEQFEENLITALDAVAVQAKIDPSMTVDDFKKQIRDTALVTLAVSGPTVGAGALKETLAAKPTYQKTDEELQLEANLILADAATTQPGEADIPTGGPAAPDAAPDGGAVAPGAPEPVAPGGTQPVAGPEPVAAEAVPGVQSGVAAEPVLVPEDAGVTPTTTPDETAPIEEAPAPEGVADDALVSEQPVVPLTEAQPDVGVAPQGAADPAVADVPVSVTDQATPTEAEPVAPESETEPITQPTEPEPDWGTVFETLREREPATKQVDTESPKFKELVAELKNNRVAEAAGKLEQRKADIVELEQRIAKERKERNEKRKEQNRFRMKNKPLDEHQEKIKRLTGHGHGNSNAIKQWLVARGLDPKIRINKGWREVALQERAALGGWESAKTKRIQAQFDKLTPEAKEVVEAFHKMGKKPAEEKESLEFFWNTDVGKGIQAYGGLQSKKYFTDRGLPVPNEYDGLSERVPPHIGTAIFKNSDTVGSVDQVAAAAGLTVNEFWSEFWDAVAGISKGKDATQDDYNERKQREAEDREIAFAEQQLQALAGDAQTVDLREVRDGDTFTLGGVDYTATGVEADQRGQTQSFTLRGDGPLTGTEVTEDFFAESVTPTEGSLAHVDPAEIEAIRIAQEFPEDFEDVTEPAPTATEPAVEPEAEPTVEPQVQTPPPQDQTETSQPVGAEPVTPVQVQTEPEQVQTPPPPPAEPTPAPVAEMEDPDVVGMQNAATDRRRQRAGLPPRFAPARLTNQAAWDEAMRRINKDPAAGRDLVNDLRKSPRSIDPVETALYNHELLVRTQRTDDAYAAYNKNPNPETEKARNEAAAAEAEALLTAERIGTIEGRALQARKILVHQDFSLARLVAKATAANGGKAPSADQMKEIAELHKQMQELQTQLAAAQEQLAKEQAERVHVTVVADYKKGLKETKKRGEKSESWIERKAQESREWLKAQQREGRVNMNLLPIQEAYHIGVIGVSYIAKGFNTIGTFTTQLVKDFGKRYLPFANDIFAKSQELYGAAAPSSKVKSREDVLEDIDPEAPLNDKAIFQLVRHYINEGVDGFEPVMQAVLNDLREFYPDLTLREVHDAYSKYGQTRVPSQEEDLKLAREYKELSRLQSQLEDAQRGLAPLKTGLQREKATQRVRDLTKAVKDTMRRLNIRPTTEENQLRSSFDAIKTRLRNEYEDLDTAIRKGEARKERSPQTFTPEEEAELKALRQRRDDRKADYEAIFKKKGLTDAERIDRAERLLDRRIAEERDMLEKGILKRNREMLMGPFSPALKSRKETLDKLKAERRELQKAARPKTPELEQKYKRDLASLERRIKEEEKLLAEGLTARQRDFKMGRWTPEMAAMQARLDGLRDARRELAESRKPEKDEAAAAYERATKAIEASIQRYKDILAGVAKTDPGKKFTVDAEMAALLDQRDALRDAAAALRAMDPARIDKKKQAVLKALDKSITEITRKIQDGDLSTKGRTDFFANDPDVAKLRAARDLLNKTLEAMRKDALPKRSPEEIRNSRDRKLIESKIAKLEDRLARGDYAPRPKLPPPNYAGRDALLKEKKRLESEFNTKLLELELANRSLPKKIFDNTVDVVFGVSRAMLTSFDAGAFGRQAGLVNFMRPGLAIKNFPANFAFTEKAATRYETAMESHPDWARAQAAGLALTSWRPGSSLTDMEEVYRSRIAKKIPGVAASERAYVTYLNQVRFTYFNALMNTLPVTHQTEENMKYLARHVNMMTGRGNLKKFEGAAAALASVFFSPKYWWSRLQVLGNLVYIPLDAMTGFNLGAKETRIARQIVAVEYARLGAMLGLVYSLFAFAKHAFDWEDEEFTIGTDPRSSDFGKLRLGNTRIDFMAGLLQNVVFLSRIATGEKVTAAGEVAAMSGPDAKFKETRLGETIRLLRTKLSPAAGSIANALDGADAVGNKFTWETEILGSYIPMSAAEFYSSIRELGIGAGSAAGVLNLIGIGAATYGGEEDYVIEQDILTGRVLEPFGIKPGTFFIDQSRYEKEVKEKGWVIPKSKGLPTF